ncbi:hypothetical protein SNOG_12087 [Parastagonospora nodorum SN15]|uniref:Uncharacterized protein n=1 Tax=Phaeosphaeria nodorum (strain SN15 / ATCC MYA-4574 / FGSC 10173) TaxID=321614 RepID=Q0U827_PHANO|nr:hypothetical protein SNOG_12087 [Parastagonospora nodorum SN15]EAT80499.1 hypothetical protein SNOG_12087 [Parastagonospora nodorum SN15]
MHRIVRAAHGHVSSIPAVYHDQGPPGSPSPRRMIHGVYNIAKAVVSPPFGLAAISGTKSIGRDSFGRSARGPSAFRSALGVIVHSPRTPPEPGILEQQPKQVLQGIRIEAVDVGKDSGRVDRRKQCPKIDRHASLSFAA